jgi:hypothetical protein
MLKRHHYFPALKIAVISILSRRRTTFGKIGLLLFFELLLN